MKIAKEFAEGIVTLIGICLYLFFFAAMIQFALRSPNSGDIGSPIREKSLFELRANAFRNLSASQTKELNELTADWQILFGFESDANNKLYEEFCKEVLIKNMNKT